MQTSVPSRTDQTGSVWPSLENSLTPSATQPSRLLPSKSTMSSGPPAVTKTIKAKVAVESTMNVVLPGLTRRAETRSYHVFPSKWETDEASSSSSATFWAMRSWAWSSR